MSAAVTKMFIIAAVPFLLAHEIFLSEALPRAFVTCFYWQRGDHDRRAWRTARETEAAGTGIAKLHLIIMSSSIHNADALVRVGDDVGRVPAVHSCALNEMLILVALGDVLVAEGLARRMDSGRRGWCG